MQIEAIAVSFGATITDVDLAGGVGEIALCDTWATLHSGAHELKGLPGEWPLVRVVGRH